MNKILKKILIAGATILTVTYVAGVAYFTEYSYPKTTVNSVERGLESRNGLINVQNYDFKVNVKGKDDKSLEINGKDIDLVSNIAGKPEVNQNAFLWPISIFQEHQINFGISNEYNKDKLNQLLESSDLFKNIVETKDAEVVFENGDYVIKPEVYGTELDKEKLTKTLINAINNNQKEVVLNEEYIKPTVLKEDSKLLAQLEEAKKLSKYSFVFDFEDRKWNLEGEFLAEMLVNENDKVSFNRDKLREYVKQIAIETDTYKTERKFNATGLGEITVPAGIYGWQMNVDKTVDNVISMLADGKSGEVEVIYNLEGLERKTDDIGDTYIEIDISRQHLWLYRDGKLVIDTPVVTGDNAKVQSRTPVGVNKVWSRERNRDLKGIHPVDGRRYVYPVKYWMPIGWTGSGLHDTYTRNEYGGTIYKQGGGSGSCINIPEAAMKVIFENSPINMPVVTYESSSSDSPTEFAKQEMIRLGELEMDVR